MRNVALFASQRSGSDFNKYWPDKGGSGSTDGVIISDEMREKILQMHGIKQIDE